jgi:hypothetical protein
MTPVMLGLKKSMMRKPERTSTAKAYSAISPNGNDQ